MPNVSVPYKPNSLAVVWHENLETGEQDIRSLVFSPPENLTKPLFEVLSKETHEEREILIKILTHLFVRSLRLFIGFQKTVQKSLDEAYEEAFKKHLGDGI